MIKFIINLSLSMKNFWQKLNKPFFILAPMADVTDAAFRSIITKYGKPDVTYTEFTSADGLMSPGREILLNNLKYSKNERPIVAQLFSANPEKMEKACALVEGLGFNGIDINMGCPDKSIEKQGAGAAMIKNSKLALEIINAARIGAPNIPISVKTRLGFNKVEMDWVEGLLKEKLPALTIHLRTRKEMSKVPAHWELMSEIVKLRDKVSPDTLIIGNGDVKNLDEANRLIKEAGCDGVMLGRAIFGNPFLFSKKKNKNIDHLTRLKVLIEHTKLFAKYFTDVKSFAVMKKHFKSYVGEFEGAKDLRVKLMEAKDYKEVEKIIKDFIKK